MSECPIGCLRGRTGLVSVSTAQRCARIRVAHGVNNLARVFVLSRTRCHIQLALVLWYPSMGNLKAVQVVVAAKQAPESPDIMPGVVVNPPMGKHGQIGRASCRERVCLYV